MDNKIRRCLVPLRSLFGGSLKKRISNLKKWEVSKNSSMFFKIRENFEVIVFEHNDDSLDAEYKILIKKDGNDHCVENVYENEDKAMLNAYVVLKQLKLI